MNSIIESELHTAMRPELGEPATDWSSIVEGAERQERRDRWTQRLVMLAFVGLFAGAISAVSQGTGVETAEPANGQDEVEIATSTISSGHLYVGLALLAVLALAGLVASLKRRRPSERSAYLFLIVALPVLYPVLGSTVFPLEVGGDLRVVPFASTLLTLPCIPILFFHLAGRIEERPSRAMQAIGTWSTLGLAVVLIARALINDIVRVMNEPTGTFRLWPEDFGHNSDHWDIAAGLEAAPGPSWDPELMLRNELVAVVLLALLGGFALLLLRHRRGVSAAALPVVMWAGLGVFQFFTPIGVAPDYDFFLGDIALSAVLFDLTLFYYPTDIVGTYAIGTAALSMGTLLWLWGGPLPKSRAPRLRLPLTEKLGVGSAEDDGTVIEERG